MPFELWEIKQYSNNTVVLNQHKSNSNESISTIASQKEGTLSKAISDVSKEVKTVNFEDHYRKVPADVLEVYERLCERLLDWDGVELIPRKAYISLSLYGRLGYLLLHFQKIRNQHYDATWYRTDGWFTFIR